MQAVPAASPAPQSSAIHFSDVTTGSGLHMTMTSGATPSTQILEVKGGGLGLLDADQDGDLDLFIPNGATLVDPEHGPGARLFENLGGMRFRDVTAQSGIAHRRWSFGSAVADFDNDGLDDIYISCFGPDVLLRGRGSMRFEDVTASSGLGRDTDWSTSAAFGDLDGDGDLDLYVTNYLEFDPTHPPGPSFVKGVTVMSGPRGMRAQRDRLHENLGNGQFADRSSESGVAALSTGYGLNCAILDFTGDGAADIFVANDSSPNFLWRAEGNMRFTDQGKSMGVATNLDGLEQAAMGVAISDIDGNARPDIYISVFSNDSNTLQLNRDGRTFADRTAQFGAGADSRTLCGWAAQFADLDHDADEDIIVFNGHVYPQATMAAMDSEYREPALLLRRDGARFHKAQGGDALAVPHCDRSAVWGDLDGDGDLDAVVAELNGPLRLLRNDHDSANDWLMVGLNDSRAESKNRHGLGSMIELEQAGVTQRRWLYGGGPFQSNAVAEAHFGVSPGTPCKVIVRWPDGTVQETTGVAAGSRVVIQRSDSLPSMSE